MSNPSSDSYRNPLRHTGQDYSFAPRYLRPRDPNSPTNASNDIKPKEQQGHYPLGSLWTNSKNGNLWILANIANNLANWVLIGSAISGGVLQFTGGAGTTGFPVNPNGLGQVTLTSTSGTISITGTTNSINFDLLGGGNAIEKVNLQFGTSPIVPSAGAISFTGTVISAISNPVSTKGTGPNTMDLEVQLSSAIASTNVVAVGLSAFNNTQFSVDANGFVSTLNVPISKVNIQTFTTPGANTYTPTAGIRYAIVEIIGGGGGGGGVEATSPAQWSSAGGGGAGGYSKKVVTAASIGVSQTVTIGAGGTGGAAGGANAGNPGGTTTFGAIFSATGGSGGNPGTLQTIQGVGGNAVTGGSGSGGDFNATGNGGEAGFGFSTAANWFGFSGSGGSSIYGAGGTVTAGQNGVDGALGAGASGGQNASSQAAGRAGGTGGNGLCIITEYIWG